MIGIVDYGAGNLQSVSNAIDYLGTAWRLVDAPAALADHERVILPGVGHFGSAMRQLACAGLDAALRRYAETGRPLLGICLGAQLLLEESAEAPGVRGLGLIPGTVTRLATQTIPHMGWNRAEVTKPGRLFAEACAEYFYFAHSYVCVPADAAYCAAVCGCDDQRFCVAVERGNVCGVQFHPEKSAEAGLAVLRRFATC